LVDPRTTLGLFLRQADRFGDRTFVRYFDRRADRWAAISWTEFKANVIRVAEGLVDAGVGWQDRVLLLSENRVEWLYCDLGIQAAGAITVPVYANSVAATVQVLAEDSEATTAIVSDGAQAAKLAPMPRPPRLMSIEVDVPRWLGGAGASAAAEVAARLARLGPEDVATIAYTSGTTGRPKGAVIAHGSIVDMVESYLQAYDLGPDDVILSILPYAHILERIAAFFFACVRAGAEFDIGRGPEHFLEDIPVVRPTCMDAVPQLFERVVRSVNAGVQHRSRSGRALFNWAMRTGRERLETDRPGLWLRARHALADRFVLSGVRRRITGGRLRFFLSGGAPLMRATEEFFWALGVPIYQGWGMTELTCAASCNTISEHRLGTVGKALAGVSIRLAADGEIEVRSPGAMREYHRNPAATAETIVDGWVRTGDIGRLDEDGFLTITDRKKDLIKTSVGKYVAPQPIESRLQQGHLVQTAIVVGDSRPYVTALIAPDWETAAGELGLHGSPEQSVGDLRLRSVIQQQIDQVNAGLDPFETVKYFRLLPRPLSLESGELTPTLKTKRRVVQDHYRNLIDEMYHLAA
jgi:long-chain acyl-CoA synthetase